MRTHDVLAERFHVWADDFESTAPMYAELARCTADEPELLHLLARAPVEQQLPVLLFASVHALVLAEPDLELGAFYPSVRGGIARPDGAFNAFRSLCLDRQHDIERLVTTRVTQTNEIGRCRLFLPALSQLEPGLGPLSLVDVGASAGLNLFLDHYRYSFTADHHVGPPTGVELVGEFRGGAQPTQISIPDITGRLGIDRFPVDLSDADERTWLRACIWPEQAQRLRRLDAAIEVALSMPPTIRAGDATAELASAIDTALHVGHPVVMNSWVLNYLSASERKAYFAELNRLGQRHDLTWVFAESPDLCSDVPFPAHPIRPQLTLLMLVTWRDGERSVRHLADCHPHGEWLHWVDEPVSWS